MQPNPIPQPALLPTAARAANPRRDGAPSPRAVTALRAVDGTIARATYRQAAEGGREREAAPYAPRLTIVAKADTARAARHDGAVAGRVSIPFLAQHIAQEKLPETSPAPDSNPVNGDSPLAAYRAAAERGTIFFGLEYPLDISI